MKTAWLNLSAGLKAVKLYENENIPAGFGRDADLLKRMDDEAVFQGEDFANGGVGKDGASAKSDTGFDSGICTVCGGGMFLIGFSQKQGGTNGMGQRTAAQSVGEGISVGEDCSRGGEEKAVCHGCRGFIAASTENTLCGSNPVQCLLGFGPDDRISAD